jgi:preprotein translocase subunit SecB
MGQITFERSIVPQLKIKKKKIDQAFQGEYIKFLRSIKLDALGLDKSQVYIDREKLSDALGNSEQEPLGISLRAGHKLISKTASNFIIQANYKLQLTATLDSIEVGEISCVFSASFLSEASCSSECYSRFARIEARLVFWPYIRHFINDITYRMSIPPILLPLTSEFDSMAEKSK